MATLNDYRDRPHWSFSALNQFVNICSLQYAFQRIMRLPQAFTSVNLSFGSAFHRCLELIQLTRRDGTILLRTEAADLFQTIWERQVKEDKQLRFDEDQTVESCGRQGRDMIGCLVDRLVCLVKQVDRMIQAEHWLPSEQSFYCGGCNYRDACQAWHRQRAKTISIGGNDVRKAA